MSTKLTLNIDETTIAQAKAYAKKSGISVSKLVENYLNSLTSKRINKNNEIEITPLVKSLTGVISLPEDFDYKKEIAEILTEKYK
ncbi:DUF6364 family protein [Moheibacter lacus]|uniref:Antitoxin n=1 Tax=Moheibacter lacus TaxID=2745851 RepID=A0A838ZRI4_9FLAO|nr:DUF6364 family protein [Moheibacter lacus]MBA5628963.1 hypothetical protein [Moheibacter lacus]